MICIDKIIGKGAEAVLFLSNIYSNKVVIKKRVKKSYRPEKLDKKLRKERTLREVKLLHKAKESGVPTPTVIYVGPDYYIMNYIDGDRPKKSKRVAQEMAKMLAKLHNTDIIHGDFTIANVIESKDRLYVIDFGLGFISKRIEDKADDLLSLIYSMKEYEDVITTSYKNSYKLGGAVAKRVNDIRRRMRYAFDKLNQSGTPIGF